MNPSYAPSHIYDTHWNEWIQQSAIHPDITALNLKSLSDSQAYNYLMYSDALTRRNDGRLSNVYLVKYAHLRRGGWWSSGIEPTSGDPMLWGCFKPNSPRQAEEGKVIKYEHPLREPTRAFFLRISLPIWQAIAKRYKAALPANIQIDPDTGEAKGFWPWVLENKNIPIILTEGVKKGAALLSAGYVAIALPGINSAYRTPKDDNGNRIAARRSLIPDLEIFVSAGRVVYICFDKDTKRKTVKACNAAIGIIGSLLRSRYCTAYVVKWGASAKGVDDLIAQHGASAFNFAYEGALLFSSWQRRAAYRLSYPANVFKRDRYLGELSIPDSAKLVVIKSPKGTGKTESIAKLVGDAQSEGIPALILTHRVQLGEALCDRMGVPYVSNIVEFGAGKALGYGLCVDSLRPDSQARFNPEAWEDALIIIDECEQVFWHLLNASTEVKTHRCTVLEQFKQLIQNVVNGAGRIILSDADLSDISIDYIKALAGVDLQPFVVVNDWKPEEGWNIYNYSDTTPAALLSDLSAAILNGERPLILCSAQKVSSKWGTQTLEAWLNKLNPDFPVLRIDSESVSDPSHPAYGCIANLNDVLPRYKAVIASPSIETGVSIDIRGHFTSVWGIFQGVQSDNAVRQALARVREEVDRYVWIAKKSASVVGNGATAPRQLLATQSRAFKSHIALLQAIDFELEGNSDLSSLRTWAALACRLNSGKRDYREAILEALAEEGHDIIEMDLSEHTGLKELKSTIKEIKTENHERAAEEEEASELPTAREYEKLAAKKSKTRSERHQERKFNRHQKYCVDVTKALILKDDSGWFPKLQLHYYATIGRAYVLEKDKKRALAASTRGAGRVWMPDFNKSQIGLKIALLDKLGLINLLNPDREYRSTDTDLIALADFCKRHAPEIKAIIGVPVRDSDAPIAIVQNLLGKLGLKLTYLKRENVDGERTRVYGYKPVDDGRAAIFAAWEERDLESTPSNSDLHTIAA